MARLCDLGVREEDVTVVLALGSHRKMTPQEIDRKLGAGVQKKLRVLQSAFTDGNDLVDMGSSESGVHIKVYRGVMESDVRIGIGNIVPHGTLGWSGGAKILFRVLPPKAPSHSSI
jgi:nickel-dependent lactate racemase